MNNKETYKIEWKVLNQWKVILVDTSDDYDSCDVTIFEGTICECESYIRLKKQGYI